MRKFNILFIISFIAIVGSVPIAFTQKGEGSAKVNEKEKALFDALRVVGTDQENKDTWSIINEAFSSGGVGQRRFITGRLSDKLKFVPKSRTQIIPFLINVAINDKDASVRLRAISAISNYPEIAGVIDAIINMLKDEDEWNRQRAMEIIIQKHIKEAIPVLKEAATKETNNLLKKRMEEAVNTLQKVKGGPKEVQAEEFNSLINQLNSPNSQERLVAAGTFEIRTFEGDYKEKAIKALLQAYDKESVKENKMQILFSLSIIGWEDERVILLLKKEATNQDKDVKQIAEEALKAVTKNK